MTRSTSALTAAIAAGAIALTTMTPLALAQGAGPAFQSGQKAGEIMTYRLGGTRVFNAKGEVIGTISDVVIDANGQAQTVVVALGGFLGIGSKLVAVPFSAVKIGPVVEGARVVLINATKAQLESAPAYATTDPARTDRAKQKIAEWTKIAKDKAIELGKQAETAIEGMREKMTTPAPGTPAPAPKQ